MKHAITGNVYYIYNEEGHVLFSIKLTDEPGNQIVIYTDKEVYAGPIDLISFMENTNE